MLTYCYMRILKMVKPENLLKKREIVILGILLIVVFNFTGNATNYYVSNEGNDSNSGMSLSQSWHSLEKVSNFKFQPGDTVFFKKGDVWNGTLKLNAIGTSGKPVVFSSYGTGKSPEINGSETITGWTSYTGNIYKASVDNRVGQVFINDLRIRPARFPDEGYVFVDSVINETTFISAALNRNMDYTGTKWYGRTIYWHGVLRDVIASDSQILSLDTPPERDLGRGEGFFLMNNLDFLTQPGEWFYDEDTKLLYLWAPDSDNPSDLLVTASVHSNGITIGNSSHVVVEGFKIREQSENGITLEESSQIVIRNNFISHPERYGILGKKAGNCSITANTVTRANAGGMSLTIDNSVISENHIQETAVFKEIGLKGTTASNGGTGAEISGKNNVIEYNVIENSNYNGLFYRGASVIRYNFIKNSCLYKDDGGAIYTNTSGSGGYIHNNIILNSVGNPEGYIAKRGLAEGIYIDRTAQNVTVEHNTIINATDAGIKLHEIGNITVKSNTIYNARYGFFCHRFKGEPSVIAHNLVFLVSDTDDYEPRQLFARLGTYNLMFNQNKYVIPFKSLPVFREDKYLTFFEWQKLLEQDMNSDYVELELEASESHKIFFNTSKLKVALKLNGAAAKYLDGKPVPETFYLQPFTSLILTGEKLYAVTGEKGNIEAVTGLRFMP